MLQPGTVNVLLGQGRTAEVLRNLCFEVFRQHRRLWDTILVPRMKQVFGATILEPQYNPERGEITARYTDAYMRNLNLDLSSSGRGFQQTLMLTAYMLLHPNSVILLDEPDAHLEILRQRQIYQVIAETAEQQGSQLVIATHSEVVLNEAAGRHQVTAFVGAPHRIDGHSSQVRKSLSEIGFEQYMQAELTGWVLYLEGSTDLSILQAFARRRQHSAATALEKVFCQYVGNQPREARRHFWGLREACPNLLGFALFDRLDMPVGTNDALHEHMWQKREIENYLCSRDVLIRWTEAEHSLFRGNMDNAIAEIENAFRVLGRSPWGNDTKASDDFLDPLFRTFYEKTGMSGRMAKSDYHFLVDHIQPDEIDPEVIGVLDTIAEIAARAQPAA